MASYRPPPTEKKVRRRLEVRCSDRVLGLARWCADEYCISKGRRRVGVHHPVISTRLHVTTRELRASLECPHARGAATNRAFSYGSQQQSAAIVLTRKYKQEYFTSIRMHALTSVRASPLLVLRDSKNAVFGPKPTDFVSITTPRRREL